MEANVLEGRTALVTGASSGLGVELARLLAGRGCALVLVARREDRLRAVRREIRSEHPVRVDVVPMDLGRAGAAVALRSALEKMRRHVDVLVNNAGLGLVGPFVDLPWERQHAMLELDVVALAHLTHLFVREMVDRGFGFVLNVASVAAYQPTPRMAAYAAAKAFVLSFSESLSWELRGTGVGVCALSPGVTTTEFWEVAGRPEPNLYERLLNMDAPEVARIGLEALLGGRPSVVAGTVNSLAAAAARLLPRRLVTALAGQAMR